jgi:Uma2 family endonuclease
MATRGEPLFPELTLREFLHWERRQDRKYEFVGGRPVAMAGATTEHTHIVGNLYSLLRPHVRRGCRLYFVDVKVVTPKNTSRYPDLVLTCDPRDRRSTTVQRHPTLLIEVLSERTAGEDRLEKLGEYKAIPELAEYLLVDSRLPAVQLHRRAPEQSWLTRDFSLGDTIWLASLGCEITVESMYDDVVFPRRAGRGMRHNG